MVEGKKYSALHVDDDHVVRTVTGKYLSKNGFDVQSVNDGLQAVELIRAGSRYNLIVMDLHMPVMNGIQATKEIRALGVRSLIIGMSASENEAEIQEFLRAGIDEFHSTPMNMAKLAAIVRRLEGTSQ